MEWLTAPLQQELVRRALIELALVGVACGVVGVFLVLRGLSFLAEALGHSVLPGVAIGYLTRTSLGAWGLAAALLASWGIGLLARRFRLGGDAGVAIVFTGAFALGLAIISATGSYARDLNAILFGEILAVSETDLWVSVGAALIVLLGIGLFFRPLVLISFDPIGAAALDLPVGRLDLLLFGLIALAATAALSAVGNVLVAALLIVPAATARLVVRRIAGLVALSAAFAVLSGAAGLYLSYYLPIASGSAIVLTAVAFFGLALLASPLAGRFGGRLTGARGEVAGLTP
jgi:ABC-type Mn2+/Zn2+ transport system permease subunit